MVGRLKKAGWERNPGEQFRTAHFTIGLPETKANTHGGKGKIGVLKKKKRILENLTETKRG